MRSRNFGRCISLEPQHRIKTRQFQFPRDAVEEQVGEVEIEADGEAVVGGKDDGGVNPAAAEVGGDLQFRVGEQAALAEGEIADAELAAALQVRFEDPGSRPAAGPGAAEEADFFHPGDIDQGDAQIGAVVEAGHVDVGGGGRLQPAAVTRGSGGLEEGAFHHRAFEHAVESEVLEFPRLGDETFDAGAVVVDIGGNGGASVEPGEIDRTFGAQFQEPVAGDAIEGCGQAHGWGSGKRLGE